MAATTIYIDKWLVDPAKNTLECGDEVIKLEPRAMEVLICLAQKPGEVISREELEETVWADRIVTQDSMSTAINKLRKAFGDDPRKPRFIETVSKRGYRLIAPLKPAEPSVAPQQQGTTPDPAKQNTSNKNYYFIIGLFILGVLSLGLYWLMNSQSSSDNASPEQLPSVVVLPFDHHSNDTSRDYLSDGITDDLITELSKISNLRVIARQSAFHYKERKQYTLQDVAQELDVQYIVQGSLQDSASRIRINVQLTDTEKGSSIWAQRFDTEPDNLFATQDNITSQVIKAMTVTLPKEVTTGLRSNHANSFAAYDMFLQGQRFNRQRSKDGWEEGMDAYNKAIAIDPNFARAYGAMAVMLTIGYRFSWTDLSIVEARERALELAKKAVNLNQNSPQIYWALGYTHIHRKEYEAAEQAARQTVTISPNYADGYGLLAYISNWRSKAKDAEKYIKKAIKLNPYHTFDYPWNLAFAYFQQGRYEEAIESLNQALERNPDALNPRLFLAASLVRLGRLDDAQWEVENITVARPDTTIKHLRTIWPFEKPQRLEEILDELRKAGLPET